MAKKKEAFSPSQVNTNNNEALQNIGNILGNANDVCEAINNNIEQNNESQEQLLLKVLTNKEISIKDIVFNIAENLNNLLNATYGIAGALLGKKNVGFNDAFSKLVGNARETGLLAKDGIPEEFFTSGSSTNAEIKVVVEGLQGKDISELIDALDSFSKIKTLDKKNIKNLVEGLEKFKDIAQALSQITLVSDGINVDIISGIQLGINVLSNIEASNFLPKKEINNIANGIKSYVGIGKSLAEFSLEVGIIDGKNFINFKNAFKSICDIPSFVDLDNINEFISNKDDVVEFIQTIKIILDELVEVSSPIDDLTTIDFDKLTNIFDNLEKIADSVNSFSALKIHTKNVNKTIGALFNVILGESTESSIDEKSLIGQINSLKSVIGDKDYASIADTLKNLELMFKSLLWIGVIASVFILLAPPATLGLFLTVPFITATILVIKLISKILNGGGIPDIKGLVELGKFMIILVGVMFIGALFMLTGLWDEAIQFVFVLSIYLVTVLTICGLVSLFTKAISFDGITDLTVLIQTLTKVLIIGALFMLTGLYKESFRFGIILITFVSAIILVVGLASLIGGKNTIELSENLAQLIIILTTVLIIGALFMMIDGFAENAWHFAGLLSAFLAVVLFSLAGASKLAGKDSIAIGWALVGLIGLLTLSMLIGAYFIREGWSPDILIYMGLSSVYLLAFVGILAILQQIAGNIVIGMGVLLGLTVCMLMLTWVFDNIVEATNKIGGIEGWIQVGIAMAAILGMVVIFTAIAAGLTFAAPYMAVGLVVLGGLSLVMLGLTAALKNITEMETIDESKITAFFKGINIMITELCGLDLVGILKLSLAMPSLLLISMVIGHLAETVADISSLKVPVGFDRNGKATGYRQLNDADFTQAGKNVAAIVTALADGLLTVYEDEKYKGMFETSGPFGLGPSFIDKVIRSVRNLGTTISSLANGVADMANLKVYEYDSKGNVKNVVKLTNNDFKQAGENVGTIVTTLVTSLAKVYNENPGFFDGNWLVDSPATKVINVAKEMGTMLSGLAEGVQSMANLKIPTEFDKNGKPKGYVTLTDDVFEKVKTNIVNITTCLFEGLLSVYNKDGNKEFFESGFWGGDSICAKVINVCKEIGPAISGIANGLTDISKIEVDTTELQTKVENMVGATINPFKSITEDEIDDILDTVESFNELISSEEYKNVVDYLKSNETKKMFEEISKIKIETVSVEHVLTNMINGLIKPFDSISYKELFKLSGKIEKLDSIISDKMFDNTINSLIKHIVFIDNNLNKINNPKDSLYKFNYLIHGLTKSISSINLIDKKSLRTTKRLINSTKGIIPVIREINKLDVEKTDKFIELARQLEALSNAMVDMDSKVNVFTYLANKLDKASDIMKESDKQQEKRMKNTLEQAKKLKELLNEPIKLEMDNNQSLIGNVIDKIVDKQNKQEETNQQNTIQTNDELTSLSGTAADIYRVLLMMNDKIN